MVNRVFDTEGPSYGRFVPLSITVHIWGLDPPLINSGTPQTPTSSKKTTQANLKASAINVEREETYLKKEIVSTRKSDFPKPV